MPEEIEEEIHLIPKNKNYSLYSCPIRILTDARCVISGPLSIIINISVQKGIFPSKLKKAKVVPVYKNDDETKPGNYCPISLRSIFNWIYEKLIYHRLKSYLGKTIFYLNHSMASAKTIPRNMPLLIWLMSYKTIWTKNFSLAGSFDTVDHLILLQKLNHYGIRGIINAWFASYLLGRSQVTEVGFNLSTEYMISCGVP